MDPDGKEGGKDLGEAEGRETMIRILSHEEKKSIFNKSVGPAGGGEVGSRPQEQTLWPTTSPLRQEPSHGKGLGMLVNLSQSGVEMLVNQLQTVSPGSIKLPLNGMTENLELWEWSLASHCLSSFC